MGNCRVIDVIAGILKAFAQFTVTWGRALTLGVESSGKSVRLSMSTVQGLVAASAQLDSGRRVRRCRDLRAAHVCLIG
jgi:hypothetical protein